MSLALGSKSVPRGARQAAAFGQNGEILTRQRRPGAACCRDILFSGGLWQARGWGIQKSLQAEALEYFAVA